jgi:hypothetical protein
MYRAVYCRVERVVAGWDGVELRSVAQSSHDFDNHYDFMKTKIDLNAVE